MPKGEPGALVMNFCRAAAVIAILAAHGTFGAAVAQQKKPQQQVNPNDPLPSAA